MSCGAEGVDGQVAQGGEVCGGVAGAGLAVVFAEGDVEDVVACLAPPVSLLDLGENLGSACSRVRLVTAWTSCRLSRMPALIGRRWRWVIIAWAAPGKSMPSAGAARSTRRVIRPCPRSLQAWCSPTSAAFWPVGRIAAIWPNRRGVLRLTIIR